MANYITYTEVGYARYGTSGQSFSAGQQAAVTELITQCHGIIIGYLRSEPATNQNLESIELVLTMRLLWNAEHPEERPLQIMTNTLMTRLEREKEGSSSDDSSTLSAVGSAYSN